MGIDEVGIDKVGIDEVGITPPNVEALLKTQMITGVYPSNQ